MALENDQGSSLSESLKDTWLAETVEPTSQATGKAILFSPRRVVGQGLVVGKKVRPRYVF